LAVGISGRLRIWKRALLPEQLINFSEQLTRATEHRVEKRAKRQQHESLGALHYSTKVAHAQRFTARACVANEQ
jgi:hypothetical protein